MILNLGDCMGSKEVGVRCLWVLIGLPSSQ